MTIARVLIAAVCALAAGVAVENAKANQPCLGSTAGASCSVVPVLVVSR